MTISQVVKVQWFDELKGIGEGQSSSGKVVFLNSKYIEPNKSFLTLRKGEVIFCEISKDEENLFATKIIRQDTERAIEKATFLEPRPLNKTPEPTI